VWPNVYFANPVSVERPVSAKILWEQAPREVLSDHDQKLAEGMNLTESYKMMTPRARKLFHVEQVWG
jgi:hypothetical protein